MIRGEEKNNIRNFGVELINFITKLAYLRVQQFSVIYSPLYRRREMIGCSDHRKYT